MAIELSWYLSCDGDASHIGQTAADAAPSFETFSRIAQNAERSGFSTILSPSHQKSVNFGREAPVWDSIVNTAAVATATKTIKFLIAVRMGVIDPAICARMLSSLDHLSGGRILLNVITGGSALSTYGEEMDHDTRYRRTEEYIRILEGLWTQEKFSFEGEFYRLDDAVLFPKPVQKPRIPFFVAGSSEIAREIAVRRGDYYVFWGQNPAQVGERVREMEGRMNGAGRRLKYVTRFHIVARETEEEALEAGEEIISRVDPELMALRSAAVAQTESVGTREQRARADMVEPGLWGGIGRARSGTAVAILGSYEQCARKIVELEQAGIDLLIMSGFPLATECERVGENVIPL
ncbi:MAG: LLM class flavin-dependent oxidoreductase, partial [bacterium]